MKDPVTRESRQNENASYIPYGSFQLPFTSKDQSRRIVTPPNSCKRPLDQPRPLQACPGLPKPNQEMKYYSWKKHKRGSHVNLQKMTYHDHSETKTNQNPVVSTNNAEAEVNDAEMDAAITLTSCLSQANR